MTLARLAGPYALRGKCHQRPCWGGVAVECAPAGDGWEADVYAPGDLDGEPRGVRGRTLEEVQAYADQIAAGLGWEIVPATPERWADRACAARR